MVAASDFDSATLAEDRAAIASRFDAADSIRQATAPRAGAGIRGGQRRKWATATKRDRIFLKSDAASEIIEFVPNGDQVEVIKTFLSLTGCWSQQTEGTLRYKLPIEAARRVWRRLRKVGYVRY